MAFAHAYIRNSHACATIALTCCTCEPASQQTQASTCAVVVDVRLFSSLRWVARSTRLGVSANQTSGKADHNKTPGCTRHTASICEHRPYRKRSQACSARGSRRGGPRRTSPVCSQPKRTSHPRTSVGMSEVFPSVLARVSSDTRWGIAATASAPCTRPRK